MIDKARKEAAAKDTRVVLLDLNMPVMDGFAFLKEKIADDCAVPTRSCTKATRE